MFLRFYRLTDKLGVVLFKSITEASYVLVNGVQVATTGFSRSVVGGSGLLWAVLRRLWAVVRWILLLLWRILAIVTFPLRWLLIRAGVLPKPGARQRAADRQMARRANRVQMQAALAEDPLRTQNRTLSGMVVLMGFVLLGVIIWATNRPAQTNASTSPAQLDVSNVSFAADAPTPTVASLINTPVPTATAIPSILQVRGSLAYSVRELAQTDLWAVDVGSSVPIRITNDETDERDPAWSPDGRRLAYAAQRDGNWELYIYNLITGDTTRLTYDLSFQGHPVWSPDGLFIAYESYQGGNLDIYVVPVDGSQLPERVTSNPAPDFSPAWSPDGRRIAFTSWRDGNQDLYVFSLDDPRDEAVVNITNTPARHEDYAAWSPDGELLAFSALDEGLEKIFVKPADDPAAVAVVQERGRTPAWSPDGSSIVFVVDSIDSTHLVAAPFTEAGVATEIIPVPLGASSPTWSSAPLPPPLLNTGGLELAVQGPLFIEQEARFDEDPPFRLNTLIDIEAPNPVLSDRVNDSFNALREATNEQIGIDFLGTLEDAFWRIDRPPQPGEERRNWHMTGRAFSINRNGIVGFPPPLEVVREDIGVNTYWRVYVRVADDAQSGQLGEPLRRMPWDFASRNQGDVEAYDQGGRLRAEMPGGYYIDLTQLAADYGWARVAAGRDWRANFNSVNFWMFTQTGGLAWYDAMRELYTEGALGGFAPQATPVPLPQSTNLGS